MHGLSAEQLHELEEHGFSREGFRHIDESGMRNLARLSDRDFRILTTQLALWGKR